MFQHRMLLNIVANKWKKGEELLQGIWDYYYNNIDEDHDNNAEDECLVWLVGICKYNNNNINNEKKAARHLYAKDVRL